jgi:serine/threonine-protein kinase
MSDQPVFRSFAIALALVAGLAGLALTLARPQAAAVDGALLSLAQLLRPGPATTFVWIDTATPGGSAADRGELARAIEVVRGAQPGAIVLAVPLEGAGGSADLARVRAFLESPEAATDPALRTRLQSWAAELDHDARLERAIRAAGNVVLLARAADPATSPATGPTPASLALPGLAGATLDAGLSVIPPLERFVRGARLIGVEPARAPDADGVRRTDALLVGDRAGGTPSLPAAAWLVARGAAAGDAAWDDARLQAGGASLATAADATWVPWYSAPAAAADDGRRLALAEVAARDAPPGDWTGRVVVMGPATPVRTTVGTLPAAEELGRRIASLDAGTHAHRPAWGWLVFVLALLGAAAVAAYAAGRLSVAARIALALGLGLATVAAGVAALVGARVWLPLASAAIAFPVAMLATLFGGGGTRSATTVVAAAAPRRAAPSTPRVRSPAPVPAAAARAPATRHPATTDDTGALPRVGTAPAAAETTAPPSSLREISERLRARQEEPTRADVADLLLGRSKRPPKPRLGRYELERELGHGAMGTVYLGRDPNINRVVAVKAIPLTQEFEGDALAEARLRFFREAEMAGRLNHPSIVTVHDAGEDGGIAFIAMEYVKGRLLSEHATSDVLLPAPQVLEIVARIADALDYAHAQDIVHRDIKPANVIFDPATLDTKITDFGIARLTNASATRTGIVLGTPSFMAPEQLEGRNVNGRSDLFALGVTLFQLLAGQLPFRADSMTGLMDKIANAPHPPLRTIRPDLPPCVGLIVDRALQKDPASRFATAAEMARALRACARSVAA